MRIRFLTALLITIIAAGSYWYQSTAAVCPTPIKYRIGEFAAEFNLSREDAIRYLAEAEQLWEREAGRELFVYDEQAQLTVNFIFDERQEFADIETAESRALDTMREENEAFTMQIDTLQETHGTLKETYESRMRDYESRLNAYNEKVSRYNDQGGAPPAQFEVLQKEQQVLDRESAALTGTAAELNDLAEEINDLGQQANERIEAYNRQVAAYNRTYGYAREFTQGDYQGSDINIYKFSTEQELVAVLAHEFGHALGIDHVEGEDSLMYYLLVDTTAAPAFLSTEDKEALLLTCGDGTDIASVARRHIRELLTTINI